MKKLILLIFGLTILITLFATKDFRVVLPPVVAIGLALITHEVIFSLFCGIWIGAVIHLGFEGPIDFIKACLIGFFRTVDHYIISTLNDSSHLMIIVFSLMIGGLIGVITRSGGIYGIVDKLSKYTKSAVKAQLFTWLMGLLIFIDDYANNLIVGNTMRPLTDKFKVSREKLSFIVDSTAAPVSSLALISTWIGYEIGLISDSLKHIGSNEDPYMVFIYSLPYRFYAILLLFGIPIIILLRKDFGSMYKAECRAIKKGEVLKTDGVPLTGEEISRLKIPPKGKCHWYNAILPMVLLIISTLSGLYISGLQAINKMTSPLPITLENILAKTDSFSALIWASLLSSGVTIIFIYIQKICSFKELFSAWVEGAKSMIMAIFILTLAWGIGLVVKELNTAEYICKIFSDKVPFFLLPTLIFIISSLVSFATGTSWGTMAIIFPISIPLVHSMFTSGYIPHEDFSYVLMNTVGPILTGAIFGDHCSPISDTTIMASMSSHLNHMDHVQTQIPYALLFGGISIIFGYLPAGLGFNPYLAIITQFTVLLTFLFFFGKKLPHRT